ncbi:MAG: UDPGP type 1 family protein [Lentisphaerae bacterium]|nr:UDPGP type 1 family protein [Lentisphaerota bacterium]
MDYDEAKSLLDAQGQAHVLRFWDTLRDVQRTALLKQIAALDFASIARMRGLLEQRGSDAAPAEMAPDAVLEPADDARAEARAAGEAVLRDGGVGVLLVAGGQGSRLGFDGPKGCFPIAPITGATLFSIHARKIVALERAFDAEIPFYIMTSETNDGPTRTFFEENGFFGLSPERVRFFTQGMWPALWPDGRLVLERPDRLFMSPDGHGGILEALKRHGLLDDMAARGVHTLFYFQVDNPLLDICDPVFLGMHRQERCDVSVKVCAKRSPGEGLGVVARVNGRSAVVEYSELTDEQKAARRPDGTLLYRYGSVAIHVFDRAFLRRMADTALPLHLAHKKVPFCDDAGAPVEPDGPNAYKFEKFIFDVLPLAGRTMNLAFRRENEFSPVKNADGVDSPATAQRDMIRRFARWLESCGVDIPRNGDGDPAVRIEIDPLFAWGPEALKTALPPRFRVRGDVLLAR